MVDGWPLGRDYVYRRGVGRHRRPWRSAASGGRLTARWARVPGAYRASLFFLLLASLAGSVTAMDYDRTRVLDGEGRTTTATVVEVDRWVKGGPMAEVRFVTASGQEVVNGVQEFAWYEPGPGNRVTVEYAVRDPFYYIRDPEAAGSELRLYGRATAVFAVLAVLVALLRRPALWLQERDAARAARRAAPAARWPRYRTRVDADGNAWTERVG